MKEEPAVSNREMEDCDSVASGSSSVESCAADQDMSSGKARDDEVQQELQSSLGKNEARYVLLSRLSVFFVLLFTGALASALVYKLLTDEEQRSFEESFASNSHQLVVAFHQAVERKLVAVDGLATTITGYVLSHEGMSFPNVTLPDFAVSLGIVLLLLRKHYSPHTLACCMMYSCFVILCRSKQRMQELVQIQV